MNHARVVAALSLTALLAAGAASGAPLVFYQGADIPELGITNYGGVDTVRLHDGGYINTPMTGDYPYAGDAGNEMDNRGLIGFGLGSLAGYAATADAELRLRVATIGGTVDGSDYFDLHRLHPTNAGWAEGKSSWNNLDQTASPAPIPWHNADGSDRPYGPSPDGGLGAPGDGYEAAPMATLNQASYAVGDYVTLTIPQATVQSLIDGNNPGMLVRHRDEDLAGRLSFYNEASGANGPHLTIHAEAPERGYAATIRDADPLIYYRLSEEDPASPAVNSATGLSSLGSPAGDGTYQGFSAADMLAPGPRSDAFHGFEPSNLAADFDGSSNHIDFPALGPSASGSSARTYEAWFWDQGANTNQEFLSITLDECGKRIGITADNSVVAIAVCCHNYGIRFDGQGNNPDPLSNGWHHLAIVYPEGETTSDKWQFFVDGVEYTQYAIKLGGGTTTMNTVDTAGRIGGSPDLSRHYDGLIDEVAIYGRALSAEEILNHYHAAIPEPATLSLLALGGLGLLIRRRRTR